MRYIGFSLKRWIDTLLTSTEIDFYLLYKLKDHIQSSSLFEVNIENNSSRKYNSPIEMSQGFLLSKGLDEDILAKSFQDIGITAILNKKYTIEGIANFLILDDRLGSIPETYHYTITEKLLDELPYDEYTALVQKLIVLFNKEFKIKESVQNNLTFSQWENLFNIIQYADRFDNPIDLLRRIIRFRIDELPLLSIIASAKPGVKAALLAYGLDLSKITSKEVLAYLKEHKSENSFIAALCTDTSTKPLFLND